MVRTPDVQNNVSHRCASTKSTCATLQALDRPPFGGDDTGRNMLRTPPGAKESVGAVVSPQLGLGRSMHGHSHPPRGHTRTEAPMAMSHKHECQDESQNMSALSSECDVAMWHAAPVPSTAHASRLGHVRVCWEATVTEAARSPGQDSGTQLAWRLTMSA